MTVFLFSPYQAGAEESALAAADSCSCPKLACNLDCEYEDSVSFYSDKCKDGRVKSCARPKCIALPNAPAKCVALNSTAPAAAVAVVAAVEERAPASVEPRVGIVKELEGQVWIQRKDGKEILKVGALVSQLDKIETAEKSKVMVQFNDGNSIVITEKSIVELASFNFNEDITKRNTLLNLIKGKVRNNVKQKYTGKEQSFYQVKTPVAVAGVRGTDFIVSFGAEKNDLVSNIETIHGEVEFSSQVDAQSTMVAREQKSKMVLRGAAKLVTDEGTLAAADWHGRAYLEPASKLDRNAITQIE
ncbi:MAG: FecR domain-containing protein, partial [Bdellovibrionota bacterium]